MFSEKKPMSLSNKGTCQFVALNTRKRKKNGGIHGIADADYNPTSFHLTRKEHTFKVKTDAGAALKYG